jgi:hypothetical protein
MGPVGCPETSLQNYHLTLCNNPEERKSHLHRGGSLKSRRVMMCSVLCYMYTTGFPLGGPDSLIIRTTLPASSPDDRGTAVFETSFELICV